MTKEKNGRGPGRPRKAAVEGERYLVTARLTPETRAKIAAAADKNGRSLAQETEARLERSFIIDLMLGNEETTDLLRLLATVIWKIEERSGKSWREDYQTSVSVHAALERAVMTLSPAPPAAERHALAQGDVLDQQNANVDQETQARIRRYERLFAEAYHLGDSVMRDALVGDLSPTPSKERN